LRREALLFRALLSQLWCPLAVRFGLSASGSAPGSRLDSPGSPEWASLADSLEARRLAARESVCESALS